MFLAVKTYFGLSFYQNIEIQQNILLMSAFLKRFKIFENFSDFCSPEFNLSMEDSAIILLKCNEQHSTISKSQIKTLETFL